MPTADEMLDMIDEGRSGQGADDLLDAVDKARYSSRTNPLPDHPRTVPRLPEFPLPFHASMTMQTARTPGGQANIARKKYPDLQLDWREDYTLRGPEYVPAVSSPSQSIGGQPPGTWFALNSSGASRADFGNAASAAPAIAIPALAGGLAAAGGAGAIVGALASGVGGAAGEAVTQMMSKIAGSGEDWDGWRIGTAGAFAAGGDMLGRGMAGLINGAARSVSRIAGKPLGLKEIFTTDGALTDTAKAALKSSGISADDFAAMIARERAAGSAALDNLDDLAGLTPEQQVRVAQFESAGMKLGGPAGPTKAMITRSPDDWAMEYDALRSGGRDSLPLVARHDDLNARLMAKAERLRVGTGGTAIGKEDTGASVHSQLTDIGSYKQQLVEKAYDDVIARYGAETPVQPTRLLDTLDDLRPEIDSIGSKIEDGIKSQLKRWGKLADDGTIEPLTLQQSELLRRKIEHFGEGTAEVGRLRGFLKSAIEADQQAAVGDAGYEPARKVAAEWFATFSPSKRALRKNPGAKLVADIYSGKTNTEAIWDRAVRRGTREELNALRTALTAGDEKLAAQGRAVWNNLRQQTVAELYEAATKGTVPNARGDQVFSGAMWTRELRRLESAGSKTASKLTTLFDPGELQALRNIGDVGVLTQPPSGVHNPGSGYPILRRLAQKVPGVKEISGLFDLAADARARSAAATGVSENPLKAITAQNIRASTIVPPPMFAGIGAGAGAYKANDLTTQSRLAEELRTYLRGR